MKTTSGHVEYQEVGDYPGKCCNGRRRPTHEKKTQAKADGTGSNGRQLQELEGTWLSG